MCRAMLILCKYINIALFMFLFFFKQKTAYEMRISDWSSDVCSSDLFTKAEHDGALALIDDKEAVDQHPCQNQDEANRDERAVLHGRLRSRERALSSAALLSLPLLLDDGGVGIVT